MPAYAHKADPKPKLKRYTRDQEKDSKGARNGPEANDLQDERRDNEHYAGQVIFQMYLDGKLNPNEPLEPKMRPTKLDSRLHS